MGFFVFGLAPPHEFQLVRSDQRVEIPGQDIFPAFAHAIFELLYADAPDKRFRLCGKGRENSGGKCARQQKEPFHRLTLPAAGCGRRT